MPSKNRLIHRALRALVAFAGLVGAGTAGADEFPVVPGIAPGAGVKKPAPPPAEMKKAVRSGTRIGTAPPIDADLPDPAPPEMTAAPAAAIRNAASARPAPAPAEEASSRPAAPPAPAPKPDVDDGSIAGAAMETAESAEAVASRAKVRVRPAVEISQSMPDIVRVGQEIPVEINIANIGESIAERLVVTAELPAGVELVSGEPLPVRNGRTLVWSLGDLELRRKRTIRYRVMMKSDAAAELLRALATVKYETGVAGAARVMQPKIEVAIAAPKEAVVQGKLLYRITVTNVGNAAAPRVLLRDALPPELSHPAGPELENDLGRLEPGTSRVVNLTVVPVKPGTIANRVEVVAEGVAPVVKDAVVEVRRIELDLVAAGAKSRFLHRPCEYQFTVANKGAAAAGPGKLVASLPKGVSFVHASDGGDYDAGLHQVVWEVDPLKPGAERQLALTGVAVQTGDQVCRAVLTSVGVRKEATSATNVQGVSALQLDVVDTADPLEVGGETIYEIRLANQGTAKHSGVRISCTIPPELQPVATRGPTRHEIKGGRLEFEPIPSLAPKTEVVYKIKARTLKPGDARLRVEVVGDSQAKPIVKEEATRVYGDDQ